MGRIRSRELETGSVNARVLGKDAVGRRNVGRWAVGGGGVLPGSVGYPSLGPAVVQAPQLAPYAVEAPSIAPGAVTTLALLDDAVTGPKVPAGALGARELADGSITIPKFVQGARPVQLVDVLPVLPDDTFPPGAVVVNLADGKVYRHHAPEDVWGETWDADWPVTEGWTAQVDTYDLRGLIEEGQIGQGAVVAGTVAANAIGATELAAIYVEVGKWIRSFNWDPGVDGWAIDGGGTAEFNQVTVRNGVLVGGTLTAAALKSADYAAGTAGWALDPAGNTELNDVTVRGSTVVGGTVTAAGLVSSGYVAGSSGWALDAGGNAELNDATFRGNIRASSVTSGQLVSANYNPGSAGWALDADGNAEFNDVTIRGGAMAGGTITSAAVTGGTVTGATFQTAATGRRVVISQSDEIAYYDSLDRLRGRIGWDNSANVLTVTSMVGVAADLVLSGNNVQLGSLNGNTIIEGAVELMLSPSAGADPSWRPTDYYGGAATLGNSARRWHRAYVTLSEDVSSDARLKTVEGDAPGLDLIGRLRPVAYRLNDAPDDLHYGLVAQEVDEVIPPDAGMLSRPEGPDGRFGLAYSELVGPLIRAVQELADRVEVMEAAGA